MTTKDAAKAADPEQSAADGTDGTMTRTWRQRWCPSAKWTFLRVLALCAMAIVILVVVYAAAGGKKDDHDKAKR